jgi:hypothetical protein
MRRVYRKSGRLRDYFLEAAHEREDHEDHQDEACRSKASGAEAAVTKAATEESQKKQDNK